MVKEKLFQQTDEAESVEQTVQELDEDLTEKGKKKSKYRCGGH